MDDSLEEDYEALTQFLYIAPIGLIQAGLDGEIAMVNPVCAQLLMPLSRDGQLTNLFTALEGVAPDLRHMVQAFAAGHGMVCDALHLQVNAGLTGRKDPQILSLSLLKLDDHRLMAVLSDVTKSVKRDRELRQSSAWINTIVTGLTDYALVALDSRGCVLNWNPSIGRVAGFESQDTVGHSYAMFYPSDGMSDDRAMDRLHEADDSGWSLDEGWRIRSDGTRYWGSCLIAPMGAIGDDVKLERLERRAYSLIIRDISDRREATEALRQSVSSDYLTGLANRRTFFEAANLELQRWSRMPRPLSAVMIDADHFKKINDVYGHASGDAVLRHLAAGMSFTFHAMDIVARLGGEEFVVLMPGITLEAAQAIALRLCRSIEAQSVDVDGTLIRYTISAGVATMEEDIDGVDELLHRADQAMYSAKLKGRNRVEPWVRPQAKSSLERPSGDAIVLRDD
ncbi:sensor domain-containing diguanylate cyclase [Variovorax sp. PAMC 28711]|uniref:sensor domain-containing diguanylate cyclase n=1 Tax=Variovorax sp. PAMC 28711 TaxID=1795631 RepID=UPI00078BD7A7|nr:diguanylate cyclase [Variovorax sp. PAMC 28711]AMM25798.1 diguanylate cyclase [Variovorax sp. PAMC 28711]